MDMFLDQKSRAHAPLLFFSAHYITFNLIAIKVVQSFLLRNISHALLFVVMFHLFLQFTTPGTYLDLFLLL